MTNDDKSRRGPGEIFFISTCLQMCLDNIQWRYTIQQRSGSVHDVPLKWSFHCFAVFTRHKIHLLFGSHWYFGQAKVWLDSSVEWMKSESQIKLIARLLVRLPAVICSIMTFGMAPNGKILWRKLQQTNAKEAFPTTYWLSEKGWLCVFDWEVQTLAPFTRPLGLWPSLSGLILDSGLQSA